MDSLARRSRCSYSQSQRDRTMNMHSAFRTPRLGRRQDGARENAARQALAICATADAIAREAGAFLDADDDRLFSLLEQREQMLVDLAEHVAALRLERPTADSPLYAASERVIDEADALVTDVCAALHTTQRATMALALRVSARTDLLREELAAVQRAGSAGLGYASLSSPHQLDRLR